MRGFLLALTGLLYAVSVSAATSPLVSAEIAALLTRLEMSGCQFNRNGTWYSGTEAKAHLQLKLGAAGSFQSAEQFIARAASKSSMSGEPYLVRCGISAPIQSGQWLIARLQEVRAPPPKCATQDAAGAGTAQVQPEIPAPDVPFAPAPPP